MPNPGVSIGIDGTQQSAAGVDRINASVQRLIKSLESLDRLKVNVEVGSQRAQTRLDTATAAAGKAGARWVRPPKSGEPTAPPNAAPPNAGNSKSAGAGGSGNGGGQSGRRPSGGSGDGAPPGPPSGGSGKNRASGDPGRKKEVDALERLASALGWIGPQMMYSGGSALAALGLGGFGLGAASLGVGALVGAAGIDQAMSQATRNGEGLQATVGTSGFDPNAASPLAISNTVQALADRYKISKENAGAAIGGMGEQGVNVKDATGPAVNAALSLVSVFQLSAAQAADMVGRAMNDLGLNATDAAQRIQTLSQGTNAVGNPLQSVGQIVAQAPNLQNLPGGQGGDVANMLKTTFGSDKYAAEIGQALTRGDEQGVADVAGYTGFTHDQVVKLQGSEQGIATLTSAMLQHFQQSYRQEDRPYAESELASVLGIDLSQDNAFADKLNGLNPNAPATTLTQQAAQRAAYQQQLDQLRKTLARQPGGKQSLTTAQQLDLYGPGAVNANVGVTDNAGQAKDALGGLLSDASSLLTGHPIQHTDAQLRELGQMPILGGIYRQMLKEQLAREGATGTLGGANGTQSVNVTGQAEVRIVLVDQSGRQSFYPIQLPLTGGNQAASQYGAAGGSGPLPTAYPQLNQPSGGR